MTTVRPAPPRHRIEDAGKTLVITIPSRKPLRQITRYGGHPKGGSIAFDYGAKTFRFGIEIDEAEAKQIVEAIKERFPPYG